MKLHRQNKFRWLVFVLLLTLSLGAGYFHYRQQIFEVFAAGTRWVLVTCGFEPEDEAERSELLQSDQLRKLFYAARMFNSPPPEELSEEDARADKKYPGVGFGLVHTFSTKPVSLVIGGWLFSIPCTYFADARDCQKGGLTVARLKVSVDGLSAMDEENIEAFLSAASTEIAAITIAGLEGRPPQWGQKKAVPEGYSLYETVNSEVEFSGDTGGVFCTDSQVSPHVMPHCLLRFMQGKDVTVEVKFAAQLRAKSIDIEQQARDLVRRFQVRR